MTDKSQLRCSCPKCAHLRSGDGKNPTCKICGSTGWVSLDQVCSYRICGKLREECTCPSRKPTTAVVKLPPSRDLVDIFRNPPSFSDKDEYTRGQEDMRAKVVEFLFGLEKKALQAAEEAPVLRWEAYSLAEAAILAKAAEAIKCGKEIPGGFDA